MIRVAALLASVLLVTSLTAAEKTVPCSLTVSPLRGESRVSKSGGNSLLNASSYTSSSSGTKTVERSMKWQAEVRFREQKPEKVELKTYYIGYGDGGKNMKILSTETKKLELDKNGRASAELTSPMTRLTKTRSRTTSGSSSGFTSSKSRTTGERVAGCVVQLFGDGELLKGWSSDSRWSAAAEKVPFSLDELKQKSGRIGLR